MEDNKKDCVSKDDLREAGLYARNNVPEVYNNCWDIASSVEMYLNDNGLPWRDVDSDDYGVIHVRVGCNHTDAPQDGVKHYIFRIKGVFVDGPYRDDNYVWIDAAFDQFCDSENWGFSYGNKKDIDNVRIMRASSDERMSQYTDFGEMLKR